MVASQVFSHQSSPLKCGELRPTRKTRSSQSCCCVMLIHPGSSCHNEWVLLSNNLSGLCDSVGDKERSIHSRCRTRACGKKHLLFAHLFSGIGECPPGQRLSALHEMNNRHKNIDNTGIITFACHKAELVVKHKRFFIYELCWLINPGEP